MVRIAFPLRLLHSGTLPGSLCGRVHCTSCLAMYAFSTASGFSRISLAAAIILARTGVSAWDFRRVVSMRFCPLFRQSEAIF
jgi:hypothetical protein